MPETQCRITGGILEGPKRGESEYLHAVRDSLGRAQAGATTAPRAGADIASSAANYTDEPYYANRVPNSVRRVITAGAVVDLPCGFFATTRLRHFGDVPLNETDTFNAKSTSLVSLGVGYQKDFYKLELEVFNLLDSKRYDIAYNYSYRSRSDAINGLNPDGVDGVNAHVVEPQMVRATAMVRF